MGLGSRPLSTVEWNQVCSAAPDRFQIVPNTHPHRAAPIREKTPGGNRRYSTTSSSQLPNQIMRGHSNRPAGDRSQPGHPERRPIAGV